MKKATISQVKNHLSAMLRRVRAGESVLIFDRDEPVARLCPLESPGTADDLLSRLERAGLVRRPTRQTVQDLLLDVSGGQSGVLEALIAERREGR